MKKTISPNKVAIIMPAYNEAEPIGKTIKDVMVHYPLVICVNDGSRDATAEKIKKSNALLVNHPINMGAGAALQTGIEFALRYPEVEYFVTFDADGQHDVKDIKPMLDALEAEKLDVVLGSRFLGVTVDMPYAKRALLFAAIHFTNMFSRVNLTDTHNGMRAFNRSFAEALQISMPDMAHASEIIDKIGSGRWKYKEVPVTVRYTDYSRAKGQSMVNAINILVDVTLSRLRK